MLQLASKNHTFIICDKKLLTYYIDEVKKDVQIVRNFNLFVRIHSIRCCCC